MVLIKWIKTPIWLLGWQACSSEEEEDKALDSILLEVVRLMPPLAGGRRVALQDTQLSGYEISAGMVIHFNFFGVHTDPKIFPQPKKFWPQRWSQDNKDDRGRIFAFGAGPRECIGKRMIWDIMMVSSLNVSPLHLAVRAQLCCFYHESWN